MIIKNLHHNEFKCIEGLLKEQQLFHYKLDKLNNERFLKIGLKEFEEYMTETNDYVCLVEYNKEIPIGFIACTISVNEAFIEDVYIVKSYRSKHIGTALMNELFQQIADKDIKSIEVHITYKNEKAFEYYEKFGFHLLREDANGYIFSKFIK